MAQQAATSTWLSVSTMLWCRPHEEHASSLIKTAKLSIVWCQAARVNNNRNAGLTCCCPRGSDVEPTGRVPVKAACIWRRSYRMRSLSLVRLPWLCTLRSLRNGFTCNVLYRRYNPAQNMCMYFLYLAGQSAGQTRQTSHAAANHEATLTDAQAVQHYKNVMWLHTLTHLK